MTGKPWEDLITLGRVLELHQENIERYGGKGNITKAAEDCVEGAAGNAWTAAEYSEPEEASRGLCFTAYILIYLAKNHCFTDGNKRVAWAVAMDILAARRLTLSASIDEAEELIRQIIADGLEQEKVAIWISERLEWIH